MSKIRGVNLGEWLVLEKWMDPSVFKGIEADDEDTLCRLLDEEEKIKRFKEHRDNYIREEDIQYIKACGLNAIRLPIPHFVFGDNKKFCSFYVPCIDYVDKCISWAEKVGLKVLLDIHTAPDCQNGYDNGGICGVSKWHQKKENIDRVIDVLCSLADRYGKREGLLGLELLNEPASEDVWEHNKRTYRAYDNDRAKGSSSVPLPVVFDFYTRGYEEIRKHMGEDKMIAFHDAFRFDTFYDFFKESKFKNIVLDTHWYLEMDPETVDTSEFANLHKILIEDEKKIRRMQEIVPVIIGEWSLSHTYSSKLTNSQRYYSYRLMADAMLQCWENAYGHFFWSFRVKTNTRPGWDFKNCIEREWLPSRFDFTEVK